MSAEDRLPDRPPEPFPNQMAMRESAAAMLRRRARHLRDRAHGLEMLADGIENRLGPDADEALWRLLVEKREV